jgi:peptidoglycan/xylan/chitin deacetylase (PgdA/CDA1 family)
VVQIAHAQGYRLIMWTADTIDWQRPTPQVIQDRVLKKASNGGIVLMHPIQQTVQALPGMIDGLKAKGYQLMTVSENLNQNQTGEADGA